MKMTDRELSNIVDDVTAEIRSETLDSATVESATRRVWARMTGEQAAIAAGVRPVEQIRNCDDFQALIPAYLQGYLSSARTTLLEDHTRECVPCRKALKQARHGNQEAIRLQEQRAKADATRYRANVLRWAVAAVLVVGLGLFAWPWIQRSINSLYTLSAIVEAAQGGVYKVTGDKTQAVKAGEKLLGGEHIRTAKSSGAVVKLSDGTLVEMRERSEFSVKDTTAGATINLERGQVIIQAAKQRSDRKLFVQTDDSLVSVTGTIFSVNSGAKGARVSVREEIAWSRDAGRYIRMLDAIRNQIDQQLAMPGNRFSTRLLDLVPGDTVLYVAIPNIGETLARANEILQENLQKNDELRGWWEQEQKESNKPGGRRQGLNQAIELMREFGSQLGDEIVISAAANPRGSGEPEAPVLLAEVKDGGAFRSFLEGQLDKLGSERKHARIVDDPMNIASEGKDEFFIWIAGDLIAVSPRPEQLQSLAVRMRQGAKPFASTSFYAQIATLYRDGAGLVIAADLDRIVMQSLRKEKDAAAAQQLGVTDLRYFIVEIKEKDGRPYNRAVVSFRENQRGVTSWLAQPGPMGALEFISPDASLVAAFVVKEPTALVDDLFETLKKADDKGWNELQRFQAEQGIDLRNDFAAPLGGEYAFALDGPVLPVPSWKAVYQNAGSILAPVAKAVGGIGDAGAPKEVRNKIRQLLGGKAGLAYVYALNDRMIMSVNSEDGPIGLSPSDLLGLPGTPGLGHIIGGIAR